MRAIWVLTLIFMSGCIQGSIDYVDTVELPSSSGPYGGEAYLDVIVVVRAYEVEGMASGKVGAACNKAEWHGDPPSALIEWDPEAPLPARIIMRIVAPHQDDSRVEHDGNGTYMTTDHDIQAAFDEERVLGTISGEDPPRFRGKPILTDSWLSATFTYEGNGTTVHETLALRHYPSVQTQQYSHVGAC